MEGIGSAFHDLDACDEWVGSIRGNKVGTPQGDLRYTHQQGDNGQEDGTGSQGAKTETPVGLALRKQIAQGGYRKDGPDAWD
jgi:hypothetical protein